MTWTAVTDADVKAAQQVTLWIRTARAAGYGGPDWYPSLPDIHKSALYERIRSGKAPLVCPPPRAFACPWYAVVEVPGPHFVGSGRQAPFFTDSRFGSEMELERVQGGNSVVIFQSHWKIVRRDGNLSFVVKDDHHTASLYEFLLWYDPKWTVPHLREDQLQEQGGWFIENMAHISSEDDDVCA